MNRFARIALAGLAAVATLTAAQAQLRAPAQGGGATPRFTVPAPTQSQVPVQRQADYIVAVVNTEPITNNEVRTRALRFQQQLAQQGAPAPTPQQLLQLTLERVIQERSQMQYARDIGIKVEESAVDQAERSVAGQNDLDVAELRRRLQNDGMSLTQFRDDLKGQILLQRLRERDFEARVRVSDLEADQYLEQLRREQDPSKTELNVAQVLVAVPENATPDQVAALQAKAQQIYERARGGADFAQLARENSNAPEARAGGEFGLRPLDRLPQLFVDTVRPLAQGAVAAPVRSGAGFHVLKLVERKNTGALETTVTQSHARHILLRSSASLTTEQAIDRIAGYKRRIQQGGADFAQLAREYSQDGSAREGGDLGWVRPGQFVPEFEEVMNRLAPGEISDPVVSRFGVHLIQLLERKDVALTPREQREVARNRLREKKLDEGFENWARDIRARAYVELREPPQ